MAAISPPVALAEGLSAPVASELPFIPSDPNYSFDTTINSSQYFFDVHWNERDQAWYFDMYESSGAPMVLGVKVVIGTFLGRQSAHPFFNDNVLVAIDTSLTYKDAGFDDLGTRVTIHHFTKLSLMYVLTVG